MAAVMLAPDLDRVGLVVIGRNEGERLIRCFASVRAIPNQVYVDSGSTDGSVESATRAGVSVIQLEVPPNFTAARARNAGLVKLIAECPWLEFVQTVDGDCEIHPEWIPAAVQAMRADQKLAAVYGRLRERFPDRSIYNAICDDEWNAPVGEAEIIGGIALLRVAAIRQVNYYEATMIAGEEPDMAWRMRKCGWRMGRIDAEMGYHDVDLTRFMQWWTRTRRTGHAFAELAYRHPDARNPNWSRIARSIVIWGAIMPIFLCITVVLALFHPYLWVFTALVFLMWPLRMVQIGRRKRRAGLNAGLAQAYGVLIMVGMVPQLMGLVRYHRNRLSGRLSELIEHKNLGRSGS